MLGPSWRCGLKLGISRDCNRDRAALSLNLRIQVEVRVRSNLMVALTLLKKLIEK
jgi:hypothetical protein